MAIDYSWKGWEYETSNGLHMVMSKRHIFKRGDSQTICGITPPRRVIPNGGEGDGGCKRCLHWEDNLSGELNPSLP